MAIKVFNSEEIKINKLTERGLAQLRKFQDFINSLVAEDAQIRVNKKKSLKEEREWLESKLKRIRQRKTVVLVAEHQGLVVGNAGIDLGKGRKEHIGKLWIAVRKGYRGRGLGTYLSEQIIKLAKKELKPKPKIISLSVYPTNRRAIKLYQRLGFKKAASIPNQVQYKRKLIAEIIMLKS